VIVDLFRTLYGEFPLSSLALTVNDQIVSESTRKITSQGQFLLINDILTLPRPVEAGDKVGLAFQTQSTEQVVGAATIYITPESCGFPVSYSPSLYWSETEFSVKHLRNQPGEQITETVSYEQYPGLDNSKGAAPLPVQIEFRRNFRHQIIERITNTQVSGRHVQEMIVEMYKLPPNDPVQKALCPLNIVIPAGQKSKITVEWTERWAEGVINEGREGTGNRLGTYTIFLGYVEPCSLIKQENFTQWGYQPAPMVKHGYRSGFPHESRSLRAVFTNYPTYICYPFRLHTGQP